MIFHLLRWRKGRFWAVLCWALTVAMPVYAQLDTLHWIPPMYAQAGIGPQFVYLATPEESPFPVMIHDGGGNLVATAQISSSQPFRYELSDTYSQLLIPDNLMGKVLPAAGLVISGPRPFYAYFRALSPGGADACDLTCKGGAALGKVFRIGHLVQVSDKTGGRSNFIGVLATEDATQVTLSGFDPITIFKGATNVDADGKVHVTLQRGESVVWGHYVGEIGDDQPRNGFMGALLTASKPVAVNCGSWLGAPVIYGVNDIALDQIVPFERVGKEYILCRGGGPTSLEHPIVIAHENGTQVWVNGDPIPVATLDGGKYFIIPTNRYSPAGNMYIRGSKPVFVYQMTGGVFEGKYSLRTAGLMFVPPLNCGLPHTVGPIYQPNKTGDLKFDGGLTVVAPRDSAVTVRISGVPVPLGPPSAVPGNTDFVTYRQLDLFPHNKAAVMQNLRVESGGAIQVALINRYLDAGFSAFYSGFETRKPEVKLARKGDGICPDTLVAAGYFEGLQWIYEDSVLQQGPDSLFVVLAPGQYKAVGYIGACFSTATVADSILVPLTAPQFPYSVQDATCFGAYDGQITFGQPNGGTPPYLFSIDNGYRFTPETVFSGVAAGNYRLIVQDASGCYNQPIHLNVGQPDSFYVNIVPRLLPDPFRSGELAELQAFPSHPVTAVDWAPVDSIGCTDCYRYFIRPEASTWVRVTVQDSTGCRATDSLLLIVDPLIYAPNVIDPNSVNGNDVFSLFSKDPLPIHQLRIFDRWGALVFERTNFLTNNPADGWNGHYRGKTATLGVYTFFAEVEIEPGRVVMVKGDVTVFLN